MYIYLFAIAVVLFKSLRFDADYDLWGHLFWGNKILYGDFVFVDDYSFLASGNHFINHEWLSQSIMAYLYNSFNEHGLIIYKTILSISFVVIIAKILLRSISDLKSISFTLILLFSIFSPGLSFRPQLWSYNFIALLVLGLLDNGWIYKKYTRVFLPLLFLVWPQLHGAYPLGLVLLGVSVFCKYLNKEITLTTGTSYITASILPTFITPYGFHQWLYIFNELTNPYSKQYIQEWVMLSFQYRELPFFIAVIIAVFSFYKVTLFEKFILMIAIMLGFSAVRHAPVGAILCSSILAKSVEHLIGKFLSRNKFYYLVDIASLPITTYLFYILAVTPIKINWDTDPLPKLSVQFIKQNKLSGNIWVPLHWGSYVLYHLADQGVKVSLDGRWATVYSRTEQYDGLIWSVYGENFLWKDVIKKYGGDYMIVGKFNPALKEMQGDKNLSVIGTEQDAVFFKILR